MKDIYYKHTKLTRKQIFQFLSSCDKYFIPPLSERVNIFEYSKKIYEKSEHFVALSEDKIIGLLACYLNDQTKQIGYITSISVDPDYYGKGVANELLRIALNFANKNNFNKINLEVSIQNVGAIKLYQKHGFKEHSNSGNIINMVLDLKKIVFTRSITLCNKN